MAVSFLMKKIVNHILNLIFNSGTIVPTLLIEIVNIQLKPKTW